MIKGINESKTLPKHTSCECKCRFDGKNFRLIKNGITVNVLVRVQKSERLSYVRKRLQWESCYMHLWK